MPLTMVKLGDTRTIAEFKGKEDLKRHLQDLGFTKGESVKVLAENDGGLILLVKDVRVALNKGLATKIMVS